MGGIIAQGRGQWKEQSASEAGARVAWAGNRGEHKVKAGGGSFHHWKAAKAEVAPCKKQPFRWLLDKVQRLNYPAGAALSRQSGLNDELKIIPF